MYDYTEFDRAFVRERVAQFRDQVERRLAGELTEDEFKPLRLMNGLYLQLHAYMLRIAIPYGTLSVAPAAQARRHRAQVRPRLRPLHHAAEPPVQLAEARGRARHPRRPGRGRDARHPDLAATASATSPPTISPAPPPTRSRIRGPDAEIMRQWSTLHPEFSFLPRKFKIAITGSPTRPRRDAGARHRPAADARTRPASRLRGHRRRRPRPHADDRQDVREFLPRGRPARLPRGDPARLQPLRPARQQVQGADQDPRPRDRRRGDARARSRRSMRAIERRRAEAAGRRASSAIAGLFRAAGASSRAGRRAVARACAQPRTRASPLGRRPTSRRTSRRLRASSPSR